MEIFWPSYFADPQTAGRMPPIDWRRDAYEGIAAEMTDDLDRVAAELAAFSGKRRTTGMREGNERVLHRRSSESRWPRVMRWRPVRAQRSVDRGARRPVIEPRNWACPGCRRARKRRKATPLAALSRAVGGPRGVEEPVHACELSMLRTGRSHDHPPVVTEGRVVRGRPRP